MFRLEYVDIEGFRGFSSRVRIPLDADAIVVVGENGRGKTTIFDSILWALTGVVGRVGGGHDDALKSLFSGSGTMRVEVGLKDPDQVVVVSRMFDGEVTTAQVRNASGSLQNDAADAELVRLLWPTASLSSNSREALETVVSRALYLQQDLVREFIQADDRRKRFQVVAELLGAGRVAQLQLALERAKQAWATGTTRLENDLRPAQERLRELNDSVASLDGIPSDQLATLEADWDEFVVLASDLGLPIDREVTGRRTAVNEVLQQASLLAATTTQRIQALQGVISSLSELPEIEDGEMAQAEAILAVARNTKQVAEESRANANRALAAATSAKEAAEDAASRLSIMAEMALGFLSGNCPVCGQSIDRESTEQHLRELLGGTAAMPTDLEEVQLAARLASERLDLVAAEVESAEQTVRMIAARVLERSTSLQAASEELASLGFPTEGAPGDLVDQAQRILAEQIIRRDRLNGLTRSAESLSLGLAVESASRRGEQTRRDREKVAASLADASRAIERRKEATKLAERLVPSLRAAADGLVEGRLAEIRPLLQQIYSAIETHPALINIELIQTRTGRNAELFPRISDESGDISSENPVDVLSSSQANALAVAIFLSLNLSISDPPLDCAILDDPLQSLDAVHMLGLVDVLRRLGPQRQLLVSSHDPDFGRLLARKLRPVGGGSESTLVIRLSAWRPEGPLVNVERLVPVDDRLRITG